MPVSSTAGYPGQPQEHVHDHCQRRHDDEHQPEQTWLSTFHADGDTSHPNARAARWGRVR